MPQPGHFRLHGRAQPPLVAGDYVIEGEQSIPEEPSARFDEYRGHLRVTAPRFRLPPDHILSTFPPANSEGAYETRLPQIVFVTLWKSRLPSTSGGRTDGSSMSVPSIVSGSSHAAMGALARPEASVARTRRDRGGRG